MKIVMVGQGAFGQKHLDGLKKIDGVEVVSLAGGNPDSVAAVAKKYGIPHWTSNLDEALAQPGVEAAIIASPTQMHSAQAVQCLRAGKHVEIEIPIADSLADAEAILAAQKGTGLIAQRIREVAAEHRIPVISNPPLTRAIYKAIPIGREITPDLYEAVAEILAFVYRLRTGRVASRA